MINRLKTFLLWILGPRKPIQQSLQEVADSMDEMSYESAPNVQGQKLEVERGVSFKLIPGGKK